MGDERIQFVGALEDKLLKMKLLTDALNAKCNTMEGEVIRGGRRMPSPAGPVAGCLPNANGKPPRVGSPPVQVGEGGGG